MKIKAKREYKILIVEDQADSREILRVFLELCGYQHIIEANNGKQALEQAQQDCPDLILMDIHMPIMDGLTAARLMREIKELCNTPILAVTANHRDALHKQTGIGAFTDIIPKPVELEKLQQLLKKHLP